MKITTQQGVSNICWGWWNILGSRSHKFRDPSNLSQKTSAPSQNEKSKGRPTLPMAGEESAPGTLTPCVTAKPINLESFQSNEPSQNFAFQQETSNNGYFFFEKQGTPGGVLRQNRHFFPTNPSNTSSYFGGTLIFEDVPLYIVKNFYNTLIATFITYLFQVIACHFYYYIGLYSNIVRKLGDFANFDVKLLQDYNRQRHDVCGI